MLLRPDSGVAAVDINGSRAADEERVSLDIDSGAEAERRIVDQLLFQDVLRPVPAKDVYVSGSAHDNRIAVDRDGRHEGHPAKGALFGCHEGRAFAPNGPLAHEDVDVIRQPLVSPRIVHAAPGNGHHGTAHGNLDRLD